MLIIPAIQPAIVLIPRVPMMESTIVRLRAALGKNYTLMAPVIHDVTLPIL